MIQLSKILCPTDYSDTSDKAVRYAIEFARRVNAHVRFLHIQEPELSIVRKTEEENPLSESFTKMLMAEKKKGLMADVKVVSGVPTDTIIKHAHEWFADLIIMGSHGRTGLMRLMMGSVAEAVFRSAAIPVLLVKQDAVDKAIPG
ncbi:MAG: universal stress protein [Chlorobiaceae bacterium]|nr:universal stress protein [Chlorobiales bacterium]NTU92205.1 universal stress protein [Chlorobiaceae bacterium]NTV25507.1 universal stress protein [Chlorobiaceae bacterium]